MLKVKFWRIENVVLMKILEQGDEIDRTCDAFYSDGNIRLISRRVPALCSDAIFVRGGNDRCDNNVSTKAFDTVEDAKTALSKYIHAISEYNRSLTETANPESDDDIETIIAE